MINDAYFGVQQSSSEQLGAEMLMDRSLPSSCHHAFQSEISGRPLKGALGSHRQQATRRSASLQITARFRGRNTDMSKVAQFQRHEKDCGSSEVQISILSARINQVSNHLKQNRKDYSSRRGLEAMLSQRRHFMQYLYKHDRDKYEEAIEKLSIRPLRIQAGKGVVVKQTADGLVVETSPAIAGEQQDDA